MAMAGRPKHQDIQAEWRSHTPLIQYPNRSFVGLKFDLERLEEKEVAVVINKVQAIKDCKLFKNHGMWTHFDSMHGATLLQQVLSPQFQCSFVQETGTLILRALIDTRYFEPEIDDKGCALVWMVMTMVPTAVLVIKYKVRHYTGWSFRFYAEMFKGIDKDRILFLQHEDCYMQRVTAYCNSITKQAGKDVEAMAQAIANYVASTL
jgi:hypothetical protein